MNPRRALSPAAAAMAMMALAGACARPSEQASAPHFPDDISIVTIENVDTWRAGRP